MSDTLISEKIPLKKGYWFSKNPSKAWGEKFFLVYSPIWILIMALTVITGVGNKTGDIGNLVQAIIIAAPLFIIPLIIRKETNLGRKWHQTYWFKANLYIIIFSIFGNYFGCEYFFDILGMVYKYTHITFNFDSTLVGKGQQKVPVIMYLLTHAYFITYHTTSVIIIRRIRTSRIPGARFIFPVLILVSGYIWAWLETLIMVNPMTSETFYYKDLNRMLVFGSILYSCFFIASFPIYYFIDEKKEDNFSICRVVFAALSASMLTFFMLDLWAKFIGPI